MKIECPDCQTQYDVSEEIARSGAQVQCARCANVFAAAPVPERAPEPMPEPEPELPPESAPEMASEPDDVAFANMDAQSEPEAETPVQPETPEEGEEGEEGDIELPALVAEAPDEDDEARLTGSPLGEFADMLTDEEKQFFSNFSAETSQDTPDKAEPEPQPEAEATAEASVEASGADDFEIDWVGSDEEEQPAAEETAPALDAFNDEDGDEDGALEEDDFDLAAFDQALEQVTEMPTEPEPQPEAEMDDAFEALDEIEVKGLEEDTFDAPEAEAEPMMEPLSEPEPEPEPEALVEDEPAIESATAIADETAIKPEPQPETAAASPQPGPKRKGITPALIGWGALAAGIAVVLSLGVALRAPISSAVPAMANVYAAIGLPVNIRGLEFADLSHQWVEQNGQTRLVVRGEILNITDERKQIPEVVFAMLDAKGHEFFQWTERAKEPSLSPRGRTRFRAQIPAPADRVRQLQIRFARR